MTATKDESGDRATVAYWDEQWSHESLPAAANPRLPGLGNYVVREFDRLFRRVVTGYAPGAKLAEVGCAQSAWLPYFAKDLGCRVTGIDYSPPGCAKAESILRKAGVEGEVVCADMFDAPVHLLGAFDVVTSFGLVEHFDDTAKAITALGRLLVPGGALLTVVPNMNGLPGLLQKVTGPEVYDVHVPLTPSQLAHAHDGSGLKVVESGYFLASSWYVVNASRLRGRAAKASWRYAVALTSRVGWALESSGWAPGPNRWTSPYAYTVARRPA